MNIALIVVFILLGIFLLILEIFFLPGTTIAGFASAFFIITAIWLSFSSLGSKIGWYIIATTTIAIIGTIYLFIKADMMDRFSLKAEIDSHIDKKDQSIKVGDVGMALSRLTPIGKADICGITTEVKSIYGFIDVEAKIEVVDANDKEILVKNIS